MAVCSQLSKILKIERFLKKGLGGQYWVDLVLLWIVGMHHRRMDLGGLAPPPFPPMHHLNFFFICPCRAGYWICIG